jgi:hypothetical protein
MDKKIILDSTKRVEEEKHTCYWTANGYKFDNKLLALWYENNTNNFVTFVDTQLEEIRNQLSDTSIDMNHDYNKNYLEYLKANYDEVNLCFSGGADSLTILDTAVRNNIVLDKLIYFACDDIELENNREFKHCALPIIEKYKGKYGSYEIATITWDEHSEEYADEMYFFRRASSHTLPFNSAQFATHPSFKIKDNACYIKGLDKPQLIKYKERWYTVHQDTGSMGDWRYSNVKAFWLDAENIKSYVKDSLLYRQHLLEANRVDKTNLQFFKPNQDKKINSILGRSTVLNYDKQLFKNTTGSGNHNLPTTKGLQRMHDALSVGRMDLLVNYFTAMKKCNDLLPDYVNKNIPGKFAWFIDIDSLEVFTQQELIPDGFIN